MKLDNDYSVLEIMPYLAGPMFFTSEFSLFAVNDTIMITPT
jgi:hypothetical protein